MLYNDVIQYFQKQLLNPFKSLFNGYIIFYQLKNVLTELANPLAISRLGSLKSFIYFLIYIYACILKCLKEGALDDRVCD